MDESKYNTRKSRMFFQRAGSRVADWRSVGKITLLAPEWERPIVFEKAGYHVFFEEAEQEGDLRQAVVHLSGQYRQLPWWYVPFWFALGAILSPVFRHAVVTLLF